MSAKCFHNLFVIWSLGFVLLTRVNTFLLFFCSRDFQELLLSEKIIVFNGTVEKDIFQKYFIIEFK